MQKKEQLTSGPQTFRTGKTNKFYKHTVKKGYTNLTDVFCTSNARRSPSAGLIHLKKKILGLDHQTDVIKMKPAGFI